MPDIPMTMFSDVSLSSALLDQIVPIVHPTHGPEDKILNIAKSPYQETLYLDSDTQIADNR
jgi:hypothetical protein